MKTPLIEFLLAASAKISNSFARSAARKTSFEIKADCRVSNQPGAPLSTLSNCLCTCLTTLSLKREIWCPKYPQKPKKFFLKLSASLCNCPVLDSMYFLIIGVTTPRQISKPNRLMRFYTTWHLFALRVRPALRIRSSTVLVWIKWSSKVAENVMTSWINEAANRWVPLSTKLSNFWQLWPPSWDP